jgi:eukaryotic-like serine/threonine-protein kinase
MDASRIEPDPTWTFMNTHAFDSWRRIETLFYEALDVPAQQRCAFLDRACETPELRAEVESLLASVENTLGFLERPLSAAAEQLAHDPFVPGTRIAAYQLIRSLGAGGMGTVYLASRADGQFEKQVAIKLLQNGLTTSSLMLMRFRSERQILASLDHPHIARLLDGGMSQSGVPYLIMEYVDGIPIDEYCRRNHLSIEARLSLFRTVCGAVAYAHENLIVHRDIKPNNILVTTAGVAKLLDFGVAKLISTTRNDLLNTAPADRMMTAAYASPEQVLGREMTTATDVYALGVLLYESLVELHPFLGAGASPLDVVRMICEHEPDAPSIAAKKSGSLASHGNERIRGELDSIVLTAMRKEPQRRYRSVHAFSDDIQAYLSGYPVQARATSLGYRSVKFIRRHKVGVVAAGLISASLVTFAIGMGVMAQRERRARAIAERESEFLSSVFQASTPDSARGQQVTARDLLDRGALRVDSELADRPEVQASMLESIGESYLQLAVYDRAASLLERAYSLRLAIVGENNLDVANSMDNFATALRLQSQYAKAEPLFRRALSIRERKLGDNSELVPVTLAQLGECLYLEDRDKEAEPVLRRALALYRTGRVDKGSDARDYLALLLERKAEYGEAAQLLREAVEIERSVQGADSSSFIVCLHNLAGAYIDMGDLTDAERTERQSLATGRKLWGNDHPDLIYPLNNLAWILLEEKNWKAAKPILEEELEIGRKHLPHSALYITAAANWGRYLEEKGNYAGAEKSFREALQQFTHLSGPSSWSTAKVLGYLGHTKLDDHHYSAAAQFFSRETEITKTLGGVDHPLYATSLLDVAQAKLAAGDAKQAEPLIRQALAIREKKFRAKHPAVLFAEIRLADVLIHEGRFQESQEVLSRAQASARAVDFPLQSWQLAEINQSLQRLQRSSRLAVAQKANERYPVGVYRSQKLRNTPE